jgi:hypothetical protein
MPCWACDRADKNRASGYYQAGCAVCTARQLARMPRQHRMAAYVAERDKGGDVAALQLAVREQYEIDKSKWVAK